MELLDSTRMLKGLEGKPCEGRLRALGLSSGRRLRGDLSILGTGSGGADADLCTLMTRDRTRGNSMKPSRGRFSLESRGSFSKQRSVRDSQRPCPS